MFAGWKCLALLRTGRVRDVVRERAVGGEAWWGSGFRRGRGRRRSVRRGGRGDGFGVAFDAGELAGDEDAGVLLELQGFGEQRGRVDVGVAVDLAVAQEGGVFEAGDQAEDVGLFAELEVVLEADEVVAVGSEVFLAELHDGVGPLAGARVGQAGGLHGAEAEGVAAAARGLLDGQTAFEVLELVNSRGICSHSLDCTSSAEVRASRKRSYSSLVKGQLM